MGMEKNPKLRENIIWNSGTQEEEAKEKILNYE
jgi:hypothetical protein